jgi:hypothetical protein
MKFKWFGIFTNEYLSSSLKKKWAIALCDPFYIAWVVFIFVLLILAFSK